MADMNLKPTPKVAAVGTAGAVAIVLVWIAGQFGIDMPEVVAVAIAVILNTAAGYFKSEGKHAADS